MSKYIKPEQGTACLDINMNSVVIFTLLLSSSAVAFTGLAKKGDYITRLHVVKQCSEAKQTAVMFQDIIIDMEKKDVYKFSGIANITRPLTQPLIWSIKLSHCRQLGTSCIPFFSKVGEDICKFLSIKNSEYRKYFLNLGFTHPECPIQPMVHHMHPQTFNMSMYIDSAATISKYWNVQMSLLKDNGKADSCVYGELSFEDIKDNYRQPAKRGHYLTHS